MAYTSGWAGVRVVATDRLGEAHVGPVRVQAPVGSDPGAGAPSPDAGGWCAADERRDGAEGGPDPKPRGRSDDDGDCDAD